MVFHCCVPVLASGRGMRVNAWSPLERCAPFLGGQVLLISYLDDQSTVAPVTVAVPLIVLEALLVCCMLDVARRSGRRLKRPLLD